MYDIVPNAAKVGLSEALLPNAMANLDKQTVCTVTPRITYPISNLNICFIFVNSCQSPGPMTERRPAMVNKTHKL